MCDLVATKAHSQFELALKRMRESLDLYGHSQPTLFYTDNMADKAFLEASFPSLRQNVVPVEKYSHLEPIAIPPNIHVLIKNSPQSIDDAVRSIMDSLPQDGMGSIYVGFDTEWNVNVSEHGFVTGRGQTAIIQIAHEDVIYIFQVKVFAFFLIDIIYIFTLRLVKCLPNTSSLCSSSSSWPTKIFSKLGVVYRET